MQTKLQATLDFLHLEDALFCAEQSIAGGVDILEIGALLIKNTGLNSVRIFRDRFPQISLIVDCKTIDADSQEIKAVAEAGADGITIAGGIRTGNWQKCQEQAKKHSLQVLLDFRNFSPKFLPDQIKLAADASLVLIDFNSDVDSALIVLQEISSLIATPMAIVDIPPETETLAKAISLGCQTIVIPFRHGQSQNTRQQAQQMREAMNIAEKDANVGSIDAYSEQILTGKLDQVMPAQVCAVYHAPCFLERVYPLHRFTKIFGQAATIKVWPGNQIAVAEFLLQVEPGKIVVVDAGGQGGAVWGALAMEIALRKKLAGAVVYGAISDVNLLRSKAFPCYTTSITCVPGISAGAALTNIPVRIGDVVVNPEDWLLGDDSGIVCLPQFKAFTIADRAWRLAQYKTSLMETLGDDLPEKETKELLSKYYQAHQDLDL